MTRVRRIAAVLALAAAGLAHADESRLEVKIAGVRHAQGTLRVALYQGAEGFPTEERATLVADMPAAPGQRSVFLAGLVPGRYAILAYHDEDGDGHLDRFLGMIPTEGWGLSNNPHVSGPPAFSDSAFELAPGDNAHIIELRY